MRAQLLVGAALAAVAPAAAGAAGFPAAGVDTSRTGATAPGVPYRYTAVARGDVTVVAKRRLTDGAVLRRRTLRGARVVGPAALDGSTTGLSADGTRLVLIAPRRQARQRVTHLVVLDTARLQPLQRVALRGDYTLDAVSPDARLLYLVRFRNAAADPLDYAVRVYDVARRRLLPHPLVDPRHPDEKMTGMPFARVTGLDGRWVYTLYAGGQEAFVHALDTGRSRAFCVDLPGLRSDAAGTLHLAIRGGHIALLDQLGGVLRSIDATTLRVSSPPPAQRPSAAPGHAAQPGDAFPWGLAAGVGALCACSLLVLRRRYAAGTDSATSRSASSSRSSVP